MNPPIALSRRLGHRAEPQSLNAVARAAGVSKATVSKALNPHPGRCDLSEETRNRVRAIAEEMGYQPDPKRRAALRRRFGSIALATGRIAPWTIGVYSTLVETLAQQLQLRGYHLLFCPAPEPAAWEDLCRDQRADGFIAMDPTPDWMIQELAERKMPACIYNSLTDAAIAQVLPDDFNGTRQLVQHLVAQGHRKIAFYILKANRSHCSAAARLSAWHSAHSEAELPVGQIVSDDEAAIAAVRAGCTALVVYAGVILPRLIHVLQSSGIRVPADLALASCDDPQALEYMPVPITAVTAPMADMVAEAVHIVTDQIEGRRVPGAHRVILPSRLTIRASTPIHPGHP